MTKTIESEVRYYSRSFPDTFGRAEGSYLYTEDGRAFLDFFSAAGSLNYGHNHPAILSAVIEYLQRNGVVGGLDMNTTVRRRFLERFEEVILKPRGMNYKVQFPGPTGANAVEAALKLARKVTGRRNIFAFHGAYHGMSLGSLAATSGRRARGAAGVGLHDVTFVPYPSGFYSTFDTIGYIEQLLEDTHSGIDKPAAVLLETVQAEGGVNVAPAGWLVELRRVCSRHEVLLIIDDIQVGCGRTGRFFSAEHSGIEPDIVVLSKSISGLGLPLSLVLMREELDVWRPGEHTGTFRSNPPSLAGALAALEFWAAPGFEREVNEKAAFLHEGVADVISQLGPRASARGLGMIAGIETGGKDGGETSEKIKRRCYELGLIIETAGRGGCVLKLLPALTMEKSDLTKGLEIIKKAAGEFLP